jgi:acylglycerol lipase
LAQNLTSAGFIVCSIDHQGHGRSQGDRAFVEDFNDYAVDFLDFVHSYDSKFNSNIPRMLFGHSMGGLIAATVGIHSANKFALKTCPWQWKAIVLSAPALAADPNIATPVNVHLATVLQYLVPKLELDPLDPYTLSRNKEACKDYVDDKLNYHGGIRARLGGSMLQQMAYVKENLKAITSPLLVLHGTHDLAVPLMAGKTAYDGVSSAVKSAVIFKEGYHELLEDDEFKDKFIASIVNWFVQHSST